MNNKDLIKSMTSYMEKEAGIGYLAMIAGSEAMMAPEYKKETKKITSNFSPNSKRGKFMKRSRNRSKIEDFSVNSKNLF